MLQEKMSNFFSMEDSFDWVLVGGDPFPLFIHQSTGLAPAPVSMPPFLTERKPPSISPQAITTELPFALMMEDQIMADIMDGQPAEPRGSVPSSKPSIESCGLTGTTLGDGHLG
jgi:hypothetical protein